MDRRHEPARFIGADRDESSIKTVWKFFLCFSDELFSVSSISTEIERLCSCFDGKSSPEGTISIGDSACGEMLGWKEGDT